MSGILNFFKDTYRGVDFNNFFARFRSEILVFLAVFVVIFSSLQLPAAAAPGNVEQWANLTNQMFYGEQDFLFSYGPLYWLVGGAASQYSIFTYWGAILYLSLSIAFFWSVIVTLSYNARAYVFFAAAFFLFFNSLNFAAALYLLPFAIVVYYEFSGREPLVIGSRTMVALGGLVGFLFYVRFFYGIVGLAAFGSYFLFRLLMGRDVMKIFLFFLVVTASYIFWGLLVFHAPSSMVDYLLINKGLSFGNSVDMTLNVVNSNESFVAVFLVWISLNIYLLLRRRSIFLVVNILFLLFFKLGFSRTDHYIGYFVIPAAVLALVMLFDKSKLGRLLFIIAMIGLYYLSVNQSYPGSSTKDSLRPAVDFSVDYKTRMQGLYPGFKLDDSLVNKIGASTIDVYPYNNEYIFANKLNFKHRPSFQNYMTLTPALDLMNQQFYESAERPRFILWTAGVTCASEECNVFNGFDEKFSLNEDPLTASAILLNYHFVSTSKGIDGKPLVLLEENDKPVAYAESLVSVEEMGFGEWYKVPRSSAGVIKLVPDFKFTAYGRIKNLLFRGSVLKVRYKLISGDVREYRLNIINSKSGVWVSPLLDNFEFSGEAVDSIMFFSEASNYFDSKFKSKWVAVNIPGLTVKAVAGGEVLNAIPGVVTSNEVSCDGSIDVINGGAPVASSYNKLDLLKVQGWLARSTKNGELFDKVYLTLTDSLGGKIYISTAGQVRGDLGVAFKNPILNAAGYKGLIDLSGLNGVYELGLGGQYGAGFYSCSQYNVQVRVGH